MAEEQKIIDVNPNSAATATMPTVGEVPATAMVVATKPKFPVVLTPTQEQRVAELVASKDFETLMPRDIVLLGSDAEGNLHKTLDGFLKKIDEGNNPRIFELVSKFGEAVEKERLPELADKILNGKPGSWDKFRGLFSRKALARAMDRIREQTQAMVKNSTKSLADMISDMEKALSIEMNKLVVEIKSMEDLKKAYQERFGEFVIVAAFMAAFLEKAKAYLAEEAAKSDPADPAQKIRIDEITDKVQALESRALALEGTLSRIPADQVVIRQLQNAGIQTLQETATTASTRFASIKMTLLTIHGALAVQNVQRISEQGANLDNNLSALRNKLMTDVVTKAANAPGNNRLAQATQLQGVVATTKELITVVEQARISNAAKFDQARAMFKSARDDLLTVGQQVRPTDALAI